MLSKFVVRVELIYSKVALFCSFVAKFVMYDELCNPNVYFCKYVASNGDSTCCCMKAIGIQTKVIQPRYTLVHACVHKCVLKQYLF